MADLLFLGGNNVGGNHRIRCVPALGILSLPVAPGGNASFTVAGSPTFRTGFGWTELYGTDGTKSYAEEWEETDNGDLWSLSVGLFYPGDTAEVRGTVNWLKAYKRFILEVQDNHGLWRRVGTPVESLTFSAKYNAGQSLPDRRGYTLSFSGQLTACPPIIV